MGTDALLLSQSYPKGGHADFEHTEQLAVNTQLMKVCEEKVCSSQ